MRVSVLSRWSSRLAAVAVGIFALAGLCLAAEYSAEVVTKRGDRSHVSKVYVKGQNQRREMKMEGRQHIVIVRGDKKLMWMLFADTKTYMEIRDAKGFADDPKMERYAKDLGSRKLVGKEKVSGYQCDKYLFTFKNKELGTQTQWMSPKLGAVIKTQSRGGKHVGSTVYKNIKEGKISSSLFELPKGYKKVEGPPMGGGHGHRGMQPGMPKPPGPPK